MVQAGHLQVHGLGAHVQFQKVSGCTCHGGASQLGTAFPAFMVIDMYLLFAPRNDIALGQKWGKFTD